MPPLPGGSSGLKTAGFRHDYEGEFLINKGGKMKRNLGVIRVLMLGLTLVLSFAGQAWASGGGHVSSLEESVDGYKVALTFKAGQAQVGHNPLTVRIHDA